MKSFPVTIPFSHLETFISQSSITIDDDWEDCGYVSSPDATDDADGGCGGDDVIMLC